MTFTPTEFLRDEYGDVWAVRPYKSADEFECPDHCDTLTVRSTGKKYWAYRADAYKRCPICSKMKWVVYNEDHSVAEGDCGCVNPPGWKLATRLKDIIVQKYRCTEDCTLHKVSEAFSATPFVNIEGEEIGICIKNSDVLFKIFATILKDLAEEFRAGWMMSHDKEDATNVM